MSLKPLLLALPLALAACAAPKGVAEEKSHHPEHHDMAQKCDAAPAQFAMGQAGTPELLEEARVRAGAKTARILQPNQAVTMEYNFQRLNLRVDDKNMVDLVSCG